MKERVMKIIGNAAGTAAEIGGRHYARKSAWSLDPEGYIIGKGVEFAGGQLKKRLRSRN